MTVPMIVLAVGSVGRRCVLLSATACSDWLAPSLGELVEPEGAARSRTRWSRCSWSAFSALGVLVAWLDGRAPPRPGRAARAVSLPVRAARRDLYANAINEALIARPGIWLTRALVYFDNRGVDGLVNGTAAVLGGSSAGCAGCRPASSARTR